MKEMPDHNLRSSHVLSCIRWNNRRCLALASPRVGHLRRNYLRRFTTVPVIRGIRIHYCVPPSHLHCLLAKYLSGQDMHVKSVMLDSGRLKWNIRMHGGLHRSILSRSKTPHTIGSTSMAERAFKPFMLIIHARWGSVP